MLIAGPAESQLVSANKSRDKKGCLVCRRMQIVSDWATERLRTGKGAGDTPTRPEQSVVRDIWGTGCQVSDAWGPASRRPRQIDDVATASTADRARNTTTLALIGRPQDEFKYVCVCVIRLIFVSILKRRITKNKIKLSVWNHSEPTTISIGTCDWSGYY